MVKWCCSSKFDSRAWQAGWYRTSSAVHDPRVMTGLSEGSLSQLFLKGVNAPTAKTPSITFIACSHLQPQVTSALPLLLLFAAVDCMQEDQLLDLIMLQLRLADGLDLQAVQQQFGAPVVAALLPVIQDMMQRGLMQLSQGPAQQHTPAGLVMTNQQHLSTAAGLTQPQYVSTGTVGDAGGSLLTAQPEEVHLTGLQECSTVGGTCSQAVQDRLQAGLACCSKIAEAEAGLACRVRLTDPRGFLLSNNVIAELFAVLEPSMLIDVTGVK